MKKSELLLFIFHIVQSSFCCMILYTSLLFKKVLSLYAPTVTLKINEKSGDNDLKDCPLLPSVIQKKHLKKSTTYNDGKV